MIVPIIWNNILLIKQVKKGAVNPMTNRISAGHKDLSVELEVLIVKDGGQFVAYCPALELSGYGDTVKEAKYSFQASIDIFLKDTQEKGTLQKILIELGWTLNRDYYTPPHVTLTDFINNISLLGAAKPKSVFKEKIQMPVV